MNDGITHRCTDLRNAERLVELHGADLRFVGAWSRWMTWNGKCWSLDDSGAVMRAAAATARRLVEEALAELAVANQIFASAPQNDAAAASKKDAERVLAWCIGSQNERRLAAMVTLAKSFVSICVSHEKLDADPQALNVDNGTLDLRTGTLRPHRRADLITKLAPVTYDAMATCPVWEWFLDRAMGSDGELVRYLQRMLGYSLTGLTREHALGFFFGGGANGKSTCLSTIHAMLGDYAAPAPRGLLFRSRGERHPTELASLFGRRFVTCAEIESGQAFDEAFVKDLTGGDVLTARRMREDFWSFAPTHKLFIAGNHKPLVRGDDDGIWRRMRLVPWTVTIPPEERDKMLSEKLRAELPGILAWCVRGCVAWQQHGLGEPPAVKNATAAYRNESDVLGQFFDSNLVFEPTARVVRKTLRTTYEEWCTEQGYEPFGARRFAERLRARGVVDKGVREGARVLDGWQGVRLATAEERAARVWGVGTVGTTLPLDATTIAGDAMPNESPNIDAKSLQAVGSREIVGSDYQLDRSCGRADHNQLGSAPYEVPTSLQDDELFVDWVDRELGLPTGTEDS